MVYEGEIYSSNSCGDFEVIEYINARKVKIKFIATGYTKYVANKEIENGGIKDPTHPSVHGIGYIGNGKYVGYKQGSPTREYSVWFSMISRCYNNNDGCYNRYGGRGVYVCSEWYDFQIFALWYEDNYIDGFELDKDLLIAGNKVYSPNHCVFLPADINKMLTTSVAARGELPVGVCRSKDTTLKYRADVAEHKNGYSTYLGTFGTPEEAFDAYKKVKLKSIRSCAKSYKDLGLISDLIYDKLMNYEIVPYPE